MTTEPLSTRRLSASEFEALRSERDDLLVRADEMQVPLLRAERLVIASIARDMFPDVSLVAFKNEGKRTVEFFDSDVNEIATTPEQRRTFVRDLKEVVGPKPVGRWFKRPSYERVYLAEFNPETPDS